VNTAKAKPTFFQRIIYAPDYLPYGLLAVILVVLCAFIGWLDHQLGTEWSAFLLYALPITLSVWWGGRRLGLVLAGMCFLLCFITNYDNHPFSGQPAYLLAMVSRLLVFIIAALAASAVKDRHDADAARIEALEEMRQLEQEIISISEYEQQRIGQDLHDGVCQQLAAISCAARALAEDLESRGVPETRDAAAIEMSIQAAVIEARSLARGIFPVHVDRTGLSTALTELAETTSRMTGIAIDVAEWSEVHVDDPDVAMHLYRIAQEAVNNAVKHSGASEINITVRAMGDQLELRIEDNGKGLPQRKQDRAEGLGLRTMRYRAQALGTGIEFDSRPEGGTSVSCLMKVRTRHEDAS
jgi:signal transduction histidine kinase